MEAKPYTKSLQDELDWKLMDQLSGVVSQISNFCFETKKFCVTTIFVVLALVAKFRTVLAQAAETYKGRKKVLGVYIGWRGASSKSKFFDSFTFWDRKNTAHEIGTQGLTSLMLELEQTIKGSSNYTQHQMLTIGHSFGAAALFSAIKPVMAERLVRTRNVIAKYGVEGYGDMVVLLNPAFEGVKYASLFELSQSDCLAYPDYQVPRLVILSSEEDFPVRWLFPTGRFFTTIFENHDEVEFVHCRGVNSPRKFKLNTWNTDRYAVGHNECLVTHDLRKRSDNEKVYENCGLTPISNEPLMTINNNVSLTSRGITVPNHPYLNIWTDGAVMDGHSDIWTENVKTFILSLLKRTEEPNSKLAQKYKR